MGSTQPGRTLIWPLLSIGAPRAGEAFFFFRGVITGLLLTASLSAARDFRMTASACRCTKHLSKGRPPGPEDHGDCGTEIPRPRNSSVPPRRPFKTRGSAPKGGPVRFWLDGRAATRRTFKAILQGFPEPVAVPGANPTVGVRGIGVREGTRARLSHNTPSPRTLAPSWPQLGHQLPGTVRRSLTTAEVGRRVFEVADFRRGRASYEAKNRLRSKTSCLRSR